MPEATIVKSIYSNIKIKYLRGEVCVSKWIQKFIKSLLVEFLVLILLNFLWIPHLHLEKIEKQQSKYTAQLFWGKNA